MREGLAQLVAQSELSLSFMDSEVFEKFMKEYANPSFKRIPRNTIRSDILKMFTDMKKDLITLFANVPLMSICITADLWSARNAIGYIVVTSHFIDESWKLNKRILGFRNCEYPHSGTTICRFIMTILQEYSIKDRIFSITLDNASANDTAISRFKDFLQLDFTRDSLFHMRCVCHILNLIVKDGMLYISSHIEIIRSAISYIIGSNSRQQEYKEFCKTAQLKPRNLKTDVENRWNSTYLMLQNARPYWQVICAYINEKTQSIRIDKSNCDIANIFLDFLKPFYDATNKCSGIYYPTSNIIIPIFIELTCNFAKYRQVQEFSNILHKMETKFKKYWQNIPLIFCYACIMDPRFKLKGVCLMLNKISTNLCVPSLITSDDVTNGIANLYAFYEIKYSNVSRQQPHTESSLTSRGCEGSFSIDDIWSELQSDNYSSSSTNELNIYFEARYQISRDENFEILNWWKVHSTTYPILSIMARDLLTSPVSTVASESAFSAGGRVIDERRGKLAPDFVEALICIKDWKDAKTRDQQRDDEILEEFKQLEVED